MKPLRYICALIITLAVVLPLHFAQMMVEQVNTLSQQINSLRADFERLEQEDKTRIIQQQLDSLERQIDALQQGQRNLRERTDFLDRSGERTTKQSMTVTAYDLSYASCGKLPNHPQYGITACGKKVIEWYTVAAGPAIPFGTKVFIPYFRDKPNGGWFVVQDRGGKIKDNCIDVYVSSNTACMEFGRRQLDVWILQ